MVADMDVLLKNLEKASVLLAVTAVLFALLVWCENDRKISFTWDTVGGKLPL